MIRRVVEAFGADYLQWRVLTRAMLKSDFRGASGLNMGATTASSTGPGLLIGSMIMYFLMGIWVATIVGYTGWASGTDSAEIVHRGTLLGGTAGLTTVGVIVGMAVLIDFQSVVISPTDYDILAHQPVSSRTYFLVKLTNVLVYTLAIGALVGGTATFPVLFLAGPLAAAGWMAGLAGITVATTLTMVCCYAALLRLVSPHRLRRALSYVHLALMLAVFCAPFLLTEALEPVFEIAREQGGIPTPPWLILAPPAWFASFLALAAGEWNAAYPVAALAGVASVAVLLHYARSRLSFAYAESLSQMTTVSRPDVKSSAPRHSGRSRLPRELSVVATLVRGQFRDDMTFRLGVLGMLPATLMYFFLAVRNGPLPDPFVEFGLYPMGLGLLHFAAIGFPLAMLETLFRSESFPASWMFFAAPTDRARLVVNSGLCVTVLFVAPYMLVFFGIFAWSFGDLWHAVAHTLVLGLIAHLAIQMLLLAAPRLPFSQPPKKGGRMASLVGMIVVGMVIAVFLPLANELAYSRTAFTIAYIGVLAVLGVLMPLAVRRGVRGRVERLEFAG
ncbi:MAG: hypothetical protein OXF01_11265 [Gemmatimonadetes bacterium]|nr:hypothetical protein [Gemmatimonadota bacterium]